VSAGKQKVNPVQESRLEGEYIGREGSANEENMTLYIAAECQYLDRWTVVHCCDSRQEKGGLFEELIGSEDATKIRSVGSAQLFHALLSGIPTKCTDLITGCRRAIEEYAMSPGGVNSDLEISQLLESLRSAAAKRKKEIINHHVEMALGLSLQEFLNTGRDKFTVDHYNQLWSEIRNLDLGADLIFSGFHNKESIVLRLDRAGQVHWENNYSVVGIGSDIALVFLGQRDYDCFSIGLMDCLFRILEAKHAAQRNRHVGEGSLILIATEGVGRFALTNKGWDAFEKAVASGKVPAFDEQFIETGSASSRAGMLA